MSEVKRAEVRRVPINEKHIDADVGYLGTERGVEVQVVNQQKVIWARRVLSNRVSLDEHRIPFFTRRLARAERKAEAVAATLNA